MPPPDLPSLDQPAVSPQPGTPTLAVPGDEGFYRSLRSLPREMPTAPKARRSVPPELAYAFSLERLFWALHMKGLGPDAVEVLPRSQRLALRFHKKLFTPKDLSLKQAFATLELVRPAPGLVPADPDARKRAAALERWFTSDVADTVMWCLLRPPVVPAPKNAAAYVATNGAAKEASPKPAFADQFLTVIIMRALDTVQSLCAQQSYLFGNTPTRADITVAAVLAPVVRKQGWVWAGRNWSPMASLTGNSALARHPAAHWVRMMYDLHTPMPIIAPEQTRAWVP
ncbi:MAG: hypothetical protein JNM81_01455 [Rhodospirillaceae bacterium]|nr:hypothetical protein [Rhodospirillaceae bacterium]